MLPLSHNATCCNDGILSEYQTHFLATICKGRLGAHFYTPVTIGPETPELKN